MYKLLFKKSVSDDFKRIDRQHTCRILSAIEQLSINPYPKNMKKLKGFENLYRLRVGDYRVIYEVDEENKTIVVHYVRHRKDAYKF